MMTLMMKNLRSSSKSSLRIKIIKVSKYSSNSSSKSKRSNRRGPVFNGKLLILGVRKIATLVMIVKFRRWEVMMILFEVVDVI